MQDPIRSFTSELFRAWRRLLTAPVRTLRLVWARSRRQSARWAEGWLLVWRYLTDTGAAWSGETPQCVTTPASFGLRAFVAGLLVATGILLGTGSSLATAGLSALIELLWAAARITIILLVLPPDVRRSHAVLACAAGLAPYAIGVTPVLRFVSLGLSAVLTLRGLREADVPPEAARASVGWAFGGQAAIMIAGVAGRTFIAALGGL